MYSFLEVELVYIKYFLSQSHFLTLIVLFPHTALLSRQHFNKQRASSKILLNGCVLLAGSKRTVYRGACQLLPLGCCSMWKQWGESAFDASPTRFPLSAPLFSLWWGSVKCLSATGGRAIDTHTGEDEHIWAETHFRAHLQSSDGFSTASVLP